MCICRRSLQARHGGCQGPVVGTSRACAGNVRKAGVRRHRGWSGDAGSGRVQELAQVRLTWGVDFTVWNGIGVASSHSRDNGCRSGCRWELGRKGAREGEPGAT